jgi:orotate phosphoribosyltransferase
VTDWMQEFVRAGAIWLHDGFGKSPHALLTSGLHSDGYVNCTFVMQRPALVRGMLTAHDGLRPLLPTGAEKPDWVVGSAMGAITFAFAAAEQLGAQAAFTEKDGDGMKLARFSIHAGAKVLAVEDVISTGGSTLKTIEALRRCDAVQVLPYVVCLVNRSGMEEIGGFQIRALITPSIHTWKPEECPLCKQGSKALRPKEHWKELTGLTGL